MSGSPNLSRPRSSRPGGFLSFLHPTPAWIAIFSFVLLNVAGAGITPLVFPATAFLVAIFLYRRYPALYTGFVWWLWFLSPLARRLIDYRSGGYQSQSWVLTAPFLVTLVTLPRFLNYVRKGYPYRQGGFPFVLAFIAVLYSFGLGLAAIPASGFNFKLIRTFIEWLAPISFGFYLFSHGQNYPALARNIRRVFFWGALVMGGYGLWQYLSMPPWDLQWKNAVIEYENFNNVTDQIWSTSNSPGHFGAFMVPCLLLLIGGANPTPLVPLVSIACSLSFLLAQVRTTWGAFAVGLLVLAGNFSLKFQMRLLILVLVVALSVVPLANLEPFSGLITSRVQTLSNLDSDYSFRARKGIYDSLLEKSFLNPIGNGMASLDLADSGILVVLYEMGWLGTVFLVGGLISLFTSLFRGMRERTDSFFLVARAIVVATFAMMPNGLSLNASVGVIFWGFAGLCLAGQQYFADRNDTASRSG